MQKEYLSPTLQVIVTYDADVLTSSLLGVDDGVFTKDHLIEGWSDAWN
ncbi:MAG: hypothetical protein J6A63_02935 [Clostridia bacterium]|nr:hypothetical protein [Clostridia bacterium]